MSRALSVFKSYSAYAFVIAGLAWLAVAYELASLLVLWPAVACIVAGVLLKLRPGARLTWAWATSSAVLGLLLSAYAAFVAAPVISSAFSSIAIASFAAFSIFALAHVFLLYAGYRRSGQRAK